MNGEERQRTAAGAVPREFRRELYRITEEQLLPSHVEAIARLRGSYPHSISFVEDGTIGPHGYNCFMYALSLRHLSQNLVDIATRVEAAHPGSDFVVELLDTCYLQEIGHAEARDGSVLIYFEARVPRHAGVFRQDGFVISKWGLGHVWRHPIFEVPSYYGDEVRFFHSLFQTMSFDSLFPMSNVSLAK